MLFYEFFSGGGMARLGLGSGWTCLFANDNCRKKNRGYRENFAPAHELSEQDIRCLATVDLPGRADLAWASFPCQDLSLAGHWRGLKGNRSGVFWAFWDLMLGLAEEGRAPKLIVLENVKGTITANKGRDFAKIIRALVDGGYQCGALVIDAAHFLPQSRERLFIIGVRDDLIIPGDLIAPGFDEAWHSASLRVARRRIRGIGKHWVWWRLPMPLGPVQKLARIVESPVGVRWHKPEQTARLLEMMAPAHRERVRTAQAAGTLQIGAVFKRMRRDPATGKNVQRAEVRFDGVAGCLRTPAGGSSRQTLLFIDGDEARSRLLSPREAARLMGVPESYKIPPTYNEACHLFGDGLAVPVVSWLARRILEPTLAAQSEPKLELASAREAAVAAV